MPGFDNDIAYFGHGIDTRGLDPATNPVVNQMDTDGKLLIAATAFPYIRAATLTPGAGIGITNGAGSITISNTAAVVDQLQIYYVGKHGNDLNSGLNINDAKLTFGAAITAATALVPSAVNRFVIECFDDGIYVEDIVCPQFVDIQAPSATLTGVISVDDDCNIKFSTQNVGDGLLGIPKIPGGSYSNVEIDIINLVGTSAACISFAGFLNFIWKQLYVVDGFGVGDIANTTGHLHIKGGDIYISGTGVGIIRANTGSIVGRVDHILDIGAGAGTAISVFNGTIDVSVSKIANSIAYNVDGATSFLNLFCNDLVGTRTVTSGGTARYWIPQVEMTDGQVLIGSTGNFPVEANLTPGTGISITNAPGSITINATGGGMTWTVQNASASFINNHGFITNSGGTYDYTLPVTSSVGDMIALTLDGAGSWGILQNLGQQIRFGSSQTTLTTGALSSTASGDTVVMVCSVANTKWNVISSIGNITVT